MREHGGKERIPAKRGQRAKTMASARYWQQAVLAPAHSTVLFRMGKRTAGAAGRLDGVAAKAAGADGLGDGAAVELVATWR